MSFISSLFSGGRKADTTHTDDGADSGGKAGEQEITQKSLSELYEGMTVNIFSDSNEQLLTGRVASFTSSTMDIERLPGGLSFRICEVGSKVSVRGCSRKMMQFSMQATVQESSRVSCKLWNLKMEQHEEHRNNFRLLINTPMSLYYAEDEHFQNPEECMLVDMSIGGVCVQSEFLHGEGEVLRMRIKLEEYAPMEFVGEVVRVSEPKPGIYQYGILFAQLTKEETESLTRTLYNIQRGDKMLWARHSYGHW